MTDEENGNAWLGIGLLVVLIIIAVSVGLNYELIAARSAEFLGGAR